MKASYITVRRETSAEFVEKRSRFIGYVRPVSREEDAAAFIAEIRKRHWDASHNVYAYILEENNARRYSDDGEPAGTAGVPVLDVLQKSGLSDLCVVVTRYFGGTLLGAGGLVRAYSRGASSAVAAAERVKMSLCKSVVIKAEYSLYSAMLRAAEEFGCIRGDAEFGENVTLTVYPEASRAEAFRAAAEDALLGRADITFGDTMYKEEKLC